MQREISFKKATYGLLLMAVVPSFGQTCSDLVIDNFSVAGTNSLGGATATWRLNAEVSNNKLTLSRLGTGAFYRSVLRSPSGSFCFDASAYRYLQFEVSATQEGTFRVGMEYANADCTLVGGTASSTAASVSTVKSTKMLDLKNPSIDSFKTRFVRVKFFGFSTTANHTFESLKFLCDASTPQLLGAPSQTAPVAEAAQVLGPATVVTECKNPNQIALTFDDGPWDYQGQLVSRLQANNVKATFFINGDNWSKLSDPVRTASVKDTASKGMQIANHGFKHDDSLILGESSTTSNIKQLDDMFASILGKRSTYFRPPYGSYDDGTLRAVGLAGYRYLVTWAVDTQDYNTASADASYNSVVEWMNANPGKSPIVLNHETQESSSAFVDKIVPFARSKGYTFVTIDECVSGNVSPSPSPSPAPIATTATTGAPTTTSTTSAPTSTSTTSSASSTTIKSTVAASTTTTTTAAPTTTTTAPTTTTSTTTTTSNAPVPTNAAPATLISNCVKPKTIALTFDDGPYIYLKTIVDKLKAKGAKGTFYVNGNNWGNILDADKQSAVKYAFDNGMQIANHGNRHLDSVKIGETATFTNIKALDDILVKIIGKKPAFFRPPYGAFNDGTLRAAGKANHRFVNYWSVDTLDYFAGKTAKTSFDTVVKYLTANPSVSPNVLAHEFVKHTGADADSFVDQILAYAQPKGYSFVTVAECMEVPAYQ